LVDVRLWKQVLLCSKIINIIDGFWAI